MLSADFQILKDINFGNGGSNPGNLVSVGDGVYFTVSPPGTTQQDLWKSDGTADGTVLVKQLDVPGFTEATQFTKVGSLLYFVHTSRLWISDGTTAGTMALTSAANGLSALTDVNGRLFFRTTTTSEWRLWTSDGTAAGTEIIARFDYQPNDPIELVNFNGVLYFTANDGVHGKEIWKSDGTPSGTTMVQDVNLGTPGSAIAELTVLENRILFRANDGLTGSELWTSTFGGTGAQRVKDIYPGISSTSSTPRNLTSVGDKVFLIAQSNLGGTLQSYLWTSDGTPEGTQAVELTADGDHFTAAGNLLFFVSRTATRNRELWRSDGTASGTFVVKEIGATANGSSPMHLSNIGGVLYFTANDGTHGAELWTSTGTAATTVLIKDFDPETASGNPTQVIQAGNYLFVAATKNATDREVWIAEAPAPSERGDFNGDGAVDGSDFLTWQRGLGSPVTPDHGGADGNGNGTIDAGDLSVWRHGFDDFSLAAGMESAATLAEDAKVGSRAAAIDNIFAVGDFTSLFPSGVLSGRSIRPQRRAAPIR